VLVEGSFPRGMLWEPGSGRSWEGIVVVVVIFARIWDGDRDGEDEMGGILGGG
jgi:hypothetical protein